MDFYVEQSRLGRLRGRVGADKRGQTRQHRHYREPKSGPLVSIARALAYVVLAGLAVLLLWLTIKADLVIFAGVLFGICLRRAAEGLSRLVGLPVSWSLLVVVVLIVVFSAGVGWFFSQAIAGQINELSVRLPAAAAKVMQMIRHSAIGEVALKHLNSADLAAPTTVLQSVFGVAANLLEVIGGIVIILFVASMSRQRRGFTPKVWYGSSRQCTVRAPPTFCTRPHARYGTGCWAVCSQ